MQSVAPRWTIFPTGILLLGLLVVLTSPLVAVNREDLATALADPALRSSLVRTLWTSAVSASLAMAIAIPTAYRLTFDGRWRRFGDPIVDAVLALPPSVVGLCLVVAFRQGLFRPLDDAIGVTFQLPAVIIAQTVIGSALATRLLRGAFDRFPRDAIEVGRVLGGSPGVVFRRIVLPASRGDLAAAGVIAWARAFGEFGPVLLFAGVTQFETEVLSTSIHVELASGRVGVAATIALGMIVTALVVTFVTTTLVRRGDSETR